MPNYMLAYHGGKMPETPEEGAAVMEKWGAWLGGMGEAVVDGGNPVGMSKTVSASGVTNDGGANPLSGYSIIQAESMEAATKLAAGCPIIEHGTVEVAEIIPM
ncbi:MAG: YciI family protein [Pikeienuella sp.]